MPNTVEFQPGKDYYFISTSRPDDVLSRRGGFCSSHNMKVMFKVLDSSHSLQEEDRGQALESPAPERSEESQSSVMFSMCSQTKSLSSLIIVTFLLTLLD